MQMELLEPGNCSLYILCQLQCPLTSTVTSVFTLTIFAIERYNAMRRLLKMLQLTRETVRYAIIGIWISSVTLNIPLFFHTDYCFKTAACLHTYSD